MRYIIAGSRNISTYHARLYIEKLIVDNNIDDIEEVVSGTAPGVDRAGEDWAALNNIEIKRFPANWNKYGKSAGYRRNVEMGQYADKLIAVHVSKSSGTQHMIDIMNKLGKKVYVVEVG